MRASHEGLLGIIRMHLEKRLQHHMDIVDLGFISTVEQQRASRQSKSGRAEAYASAP